MCIGCHSVLSSCYHSLTGTLPLAHGVLIVPYGRIQNAWISAIFPCDTAKIYLTNSAPSAPCRCGQTAVTPSSRIGLSYWWPEQTSDQPVRQQALKVSIVTASLIYRASSCLKCEVYGAPALELNRETTPHGIGIEYEQSTMT